MYVDILYSYCVESLSSTFRLFYFSIGEGANSNIAIYSSSSSFKVGLGYLYYVMIVYIPGYCLSTYLYCRPNIYFLLSIR